MAKTFSLRGMLVPSQGRKTSSQGGGMPGGGAVAIGTPQESASTVINNINNVTNVVGGDYSKIVRITISDLLALDPTEVGENDLYIVYASGSDENGWSGDPFEYDGETYPAESFFQLINGKWQAITDEIDLSKSPKFGNLPEEVYMVEGLFPPTSFPNIYGRDVKAGMRIAKVRRYRLDDAGVYQPVEESTGTPGGGTSVNDMWTINVPYARSYVQGGTTHYEGGLLTAEDYQRLKENNGVMIDTEVPEQPSDTHVPSTKLVADNFKVVNLWLNNLSDTKVDETELSNYFDKTYILANYYDKSLLDEALSEVQKKDTLASDVEALGFTKNAGTITGIVFNGSSLGNSGVIRISAMPLGYFYTSSNNGVVQTGKWREIAYANVNVNAVISVEQNFSISRTIGTSSRGRGIVSVSARVSYGTVSHMSLVTDNNAIVPHVKLKYESGKLSIYVTADDAWDSWRLTSIHYPQYFGVGSDVLVDAPVAPAGGMLVSAVSYVPDIYNQTYAGAVDWGTATNREKAVTINTLSYWDGSYNGQSHASNLAYCLYGGFGTIVTKNATDYEPIKPTWAAYTQDSGAGSYITFLRMKGVTANMVANLEYQFSIRLLGRHNSFGGDCTIRVKGTVVSSSSLGDPRMWYVSGEASHPAIRMYKISDSVYEIAVLKTNRYAYAVAKLEDSYAATECVALEMITNGTSHGTSDNYHVQAFLSQSDWNETDQNSIGFIKNKPAAVTEETVSGWGFVKRKFVRRTITYSNGAYGGAILDSRGVDKCTAYNGRSLSVTITGLTTQQEYQDFLLQNTISVSYTYFEDGVATRSDGIISKISAGTAINIQLKQDMLRLTDALVYVSVVFDKII